MTEQYEPKWVKYTNGPFPYADGGSFTDQVCAWGWCLEKPLAVERVWILPTPDEKRFVVEAREPSEIFEERCIVDDLEEAKVIGETIFALMGD